MRGARVATRSRPAPGNRDVAWYDVIPLTATRAAFVVGDVQGPPSAAGLGRLQTAVRTSAPDAPPHAVVGTLDAIVQQDLGPELIATVAYCVYDAIERSIAYTSAGHCSGLLVHPDGRSEWVPANGPPVGSGRAHTRATSRVPLRGGGTRFVLFTRDLVERGTGSVDDGLARLHAVVEQVRRSDVEEAADAILAALPSARSPGGDIALVVTDLEPAPLPLEALVLAEPTSVGRLRRDLHDWLMRSYVDDDDIENLVIASNEAVANAIEHGSLDRSARVALRATRTDDRVTIEISDGGSPGSSRKEADRGRGFSIMRSLVDVVDISPSTTGTTVRLELALD